MEHPLPSIACFQSLPRHIIAVVLWHLQQVGQSRVHTDNRLFGYKYALELLHLCSRWRTELLVLLCSEYEITIPGRGSAVQGEFRRWPLGLPQPDAAYFVLAKRLSIDVDYNSIFNGTAARALRQMWKPLPVYPHARDLRLSVSYNHHDMGVLMHDYEENAHVLARHIREMVPQVQNVSARYAAYTAVEEMLTDHSFDAFLSCVYRNSRYSALTVGFNDFYHAYRPQVAHPLTRVDCCWNESCHQVLPLLRSCANSLLDLRLACHGVARRMLSDLFVDSHGRPIVYSALQRLVFEDASGWGKLYLMEDPASWDKLFRPTLPRLEFVPSLRHLRLGITYPFCDDILFRGNASTLESLWITPSLPFLYMMEQYGVFAQGNYARLKRITLAHYSHYVWDITDSSEKGEAANKDAELAAAAAQFVHRASPYVQMVDIRESKTGEKLVCSVVQSTQMSALRSLHIKHTQLTLADIVTMLQALPKLVALHCMCGGVGEEYDGVPPGKLANYMHHTYYPLSKSFRQWEIVSNYRPHADNNRDAENMVTCTLLISVMCPFFARAQISKTHHKQYNSIIKRAIANNPGSKFARKMKYLLLA